MIERFGQLPLSCQFYRKRKSIRNALRVACRRVPPDHERSVSHEDRSVEDELGTGQIHDRLHKWLLRRPLTGSTDGSAAESSIEAATNNLAEYPEHASAQLEIFIDSI
jgi:hypothetical protein